MSTLTNTTTRSQCAKIQEYLSQGHSLTPLEALRKVGTLRLGARVYDLRKEGVNIETRMVERAGKRVAEYFIPNIKPMPQATANPWPETWADHHCKLIEAGFDLKREHNDEGDLEDKWYERTVNGWRIELKGNMEAEIQNDQCRSLATVCDSLYNLSKLIEWCRDWK